MKASSAVARSIACVADAHTCLVADLGGTNARFALAEVGRKHGTLLVPQLHDAQSFRVSDFATLADAVTHYLQRIGAARAPEAAVFAVACPVTGDRVLFTNNRWDFSISELQRTLGFAALRLVNDFAAVAWAVPLLTSADVESVGRPGMVDTGGDGTRVILGPGTGLGVSVVKIVGSEISVLETEGGHIGFAPRDEHQMAVLRHVAKRYGRVSYERLLCGEGLLNLYIANCDIAGHDIDCETPEQVSRAAAAKRPMAVAAVTDFCSMLGAFAGDAALVSGAWSGVYLAGGLLPHVLDAEGSQRFRASFEDKGRFAALLRATPTLRIQRTDVGMFGAAAFATRALFAADPTRP